MRATTSVEQVTARRRAIVVTELPFNVGVERVIQRIKDLHTAKKIAGISGLTDLTDGDKGCGCRSSSRVESTPRRCWPSSTG